MKRGTERCFNMYNDDEIVMSVSVTEAPDMSL